MVKQIVLKVILQIRKIFPEKLIKNIILLDNVSNPQQEIVDNFTLYKRLIVNKKTSRYTFYIVHKQAFDNIKFNLSTEEKKNLILIDGENRLPFRLILKLLFCKYWIDSYQIFHWLGLANFIQKFNGISIYSQHGVNAFKEMGLLNGLIGEKYFSVVACSGQKERELIQKYFLYSEKQLPILGLPRWDNLLKKNNKEIKNILLYFTYKDYLHSKDSSVSKSFFKQIYNLAHVLANNNYTVYLGFHHETVIGDYRLHRHHNIHIVEETDIGRIKNSADLLITDYSSMCFDFELRGAQTIFYPVNFELLDSIYGYDKVNLTKLLRLLKDTDYAKNPDEVLDLISKISKGEKLNTFVGVYFGEGKPAIGCVCDNYIKFLLSSNSIRDFVPLNFPKNRVPVIYPGKFSFDENFPAFASGLGLPEYSEQGKTSWRWAAGLCKLFFDVNNKDFEIHIQVNAFVSEKLKKINTKVFINEVFVGVWVFTCDKPEQLITLNIKDMSGVVCIKFISDRAMSPYELGLSEDTRKLSICFISAEISEL